MAIDRVRVRDRLGLGSGSGSWLGLGSRSIKKKRLKLFDFFPKEINTRFSRNGVKADKFLKAIVSANSNFVLHLYSATCIASEALNHLYSAPSQGRLRQCRLGFEHDTLRLLPISPLCRNVTLSANLQA